MLENQEGVGQVISATKSQHSLVFEENRYKSGGGGGKGKRDNAE